MTFRSKGSVSDLAVFGGPPAFSERLHVGRPNIGDRGRLLTRMNELLDRRWLTNNGPFVQEFEQRIAELSGVKHCVATCNATAALEVAIRALDLRGEVIVPAFTFIATATRCGGRDSRLSSVTSIRGRTTSIPATSYDT